MRKSNKELLEKLQIGQAKAWDILNNCRPAYPCSRTPQIKPPVRPYHFSTPANTYLDILDKAGNDRIAYIAGRNGREIRPLSDITDISLSSSSSYGRPHKTPVKQHHALTESPVHSPECTDNHRDKLHRRLNASYSKLAADLRQIAPKYGADLAFDLSTSSGVVGKPDAYYEDIKQFRMANSEQCSVKLPDNVEFSRTISRMSRREKEVEVETEEREHQCLQMYNIGRDFRAVDAHSGSQCPLCIGADDTKHRGLIRVNIPHSELVDYNVVPRDDDSCSLASHCSAGWEMSSQARGLRKGFR